jgi:hypothetical protein
VNRTWKWPLVTRREHDRRIRQRDEKFGIVVQERDDARAELADARLRLADADTTNRYLQRRNTDLKSRLAAFKAQQERDEATEADANSAAIAAWERRVKAHDQWEAPADAEDRPVDGGSGRPTHPAVDLRRALERCLALEARLAVAEGRTRKGVGA